MLRPAAIGPEVACALADEWLDQHLDDQSSAEKAAAIGHYERSC